MRQGINYGRGVFCMPVLPHYYIAHQWLRELKRSGQRTIVAIYFQIPSDEVVLVGHYGQPHQEVTVSLAIKAIMDAPDAQGYEIIVPRAIARSEIRRVRRPSQVLGWRFSPSAKGRPPCGCRYCARGEYRSRKRQEAYEPDDPRTYPDLLAELRVLGGVLPSTPGGLTARDIVQRDGESHEGLMAALVYEIGSRRAGAAADLTFLLECPDDDVAEALALILGRYRGRAARGMLLRLCHHRSATVREASAESLLDVMKDAALTFLEPLATDAAIAAAIATYGEEA